MRLIHHLYCGGNDPHIHRNDGADESHHREHSGEDLYSHGHGDEVHSKYLRLAFKGLLDLLLTPGGEVDYRATEAGLNAASQIKIMIEP